VGVSHNFAPTPPPKQGKLTEGSLNPVKIQKRTQNWLVVEAYPYVSFSRKAGSLPGNASAGKSHPTGMKPSGKSQPVVMR